MSLINVANLTFAYEGSYDNIFENVSFQIDTSWRLGFIGRNGRGKTTFLNLLMGKYPYQGKIAADVVFDYFPFPVEEAENLTMDVLQSVCPDAEIWQIQRELALLAVEENSLYRPFSTLSMGERTKALLAALFLREKNFLLIDEPTNHLDMQARIIVSQYLKRKKGFILVSHDRAFLDSCVDHILSINRSNIEVQKGNFSSWQENKTRQDQFETAENARLRKDIDRLRESSARTAGWSENIERGKIGTGEGDRGYIGHQSARMMKRVKAIEHRRERVIEEKSKLLKNIETADRLKIHPLPYHAEMLFELRDVSVCYGKVPVCMPITFRLNRGERIALTGRNGCGKSSILKAIMGEPIPYSGTIRIGSRLVISYVPQDSSFLKGDVMEYACSCGIDTSLFLTILRKLDFSRVQFEKDMADFSQGQRKKVLLARSLSEQAHLYVWDEPLNYIDVLSRIQVENLLKEYCPTMLFVEHDRAFTESVATRIIEL